MSEILKNSDNVEIDKVTKRQDAMIFMYQAVGSLVAELCDVKQTDILSKSKVAPLPICRGICWYALKIAFDATYTELSKLTDKMDCKYTSAGISFSVTQAINLTIRSTHWSKVWNKVKSILPNDITKSNKDKNIVIQIIIPKGSKDNIKFEIKEQIR